MSYKNLEVWKLADEIVVAIHEMTIKLLPRFEMYEEGAQIRRSSKSTKSCIVEGYGRKRYRADFIKFLIYALSSNDESTDHLETLYRTNSLTNEEVYATIHVKLEILGKKLNAFIRSVDKTKGQSNNQNPDT